MDDTQIRSGITQTFRDTFGDPNLVITDAMTAADVEGWDSLTHIHLIVALEKGFRIKFTTSEVSKLRNVGDLFSLIQKKTS